MPPIKPKGPPVKLGYGKKPAFKLSFGGKPSKPENGTGKKNGFDKTNARPKQRLVSNFQWDIIRVITESELELTQVPQAKTKRIQLAKEIMLKIMSNTRIREIIINVDEDGPIYREIRILLARKFGLEPKDII